MDILSELKPYYEGMVAVADFNEVCSSVLLQANHITKLNASSTKYE